MIKGLPDIVEIQQKKSREFIENLFNNYIIISEKIYGSRLSFQKINNGIYLFKKDDVYPISLIDYTLNRFYDKAYNHINKFLSKDFDIPEQYRFGCEYFIDSFPNSVEYDRTPLNNLVLTDIKEYNVQTGELIQTYTDKETLSYWANILEIEAPPIVFEGYLPKEHIETITAFLYEETKIEKYNTDSLVSYLLKLLNPNYKPLLFVKEENFIDTLYINFIVDEEKSYSAKIVDELVKSTIHKKEEFYKPSDMYSFIIIDITEFLYTINIDEIVLLRETPDERYVELISSLFNKFIRVNSSKYDNMVFDVPSFMQKEDFKLNTKNIKNSTTKKILNDKPQYENLYRIFLALFRKKKKVEYGLLTDDIIKNINILVSKIKNITNLDSSVFENKNFFETLKNIEKYQKADRKSILDITDNEITLAEKPLMFQKNIKKPKNLYIQPNCVILTDVQILTDDVITNFKNIIKTKNKPIIVLYNYYPKNTFIINPENIIKQFEEVSQKDATFIISDSIFIENEKMSFEKILLKVTQEHPIKTIYIPDNSYNNYKPEIDYFNKYKDEKVDVKKYPNTIVSQQEIIEHLINDNYFKFKELCNPSILNLYINLINDVREYLTYKDNVQ